LKGSKNLDAFMDALFRLPSATRRDVAVESWFASHTDDLGLAAREWFDGMCRCGDDVRITLHDGFPTACVGDAAFAYVAQFSRHVNVGFFRGATLSDPANLLEGTGKFMRHVKIRAEVPVNRAALGALIELAYQDMKRRIRE
jgi:hypothetical protein